MANQVQTEMEQVSNRAHGSSSSSDWATITQYIGNIDGCTPDEKARLTLYAFSELPRQVRQQMVQQENVLGDLGFHSAH